jgi:dihydropteroate synthase
VAHNVELLRRLDVLVRLGRPVLVGVSRKRFLGRLMGDPDALVGTTDASVGAAVAAFERGAAIFRVHDVREHVEALTVAAAVLGVSETSHARATTRGLTGVSQVRGESGTR